MQIIGFHQSQDQIAEAQRNLMAALDKLVENNKTGLGYTHSIILTWDEAWMLEGPLKEKGDYKRWAESDLPAPAEGVVHLGLYGSINLYVTKPVHHVTPASSKAVASPTE